LIFEEKTLNFEAWKNKFEILEHLEESFIFALVLNSVFLNLDKEILLKGMEKYYQKKTIKIIVRTQLPNWTGVGSSASYLSSFSAALLVNIFFLFF
jgi:mevalonate kinase